MNKEETISKLEYLHDLLKVYNRLFVTENGEFYQDKNIEKLMEKTKQDIEVLEECLELSNEEK
jgi:hypothetical protein